MWWNRLSPNDQKPVLVSHRLSYLLMLTTLLSATYCARRLMPCRISTCAPFHYLSNRMDVCMCMYSGPSSPLSALLHAIRYDPFAGYARKRLIVAAKRCAAQTFTKPLYASSFSLTYALRIHPSHGVADEQGRIRNEMKGSSRVDRSLHVAYRIYRASY